MQNGAVQLRYATSTLQPGDPIDILMVGLVGTEWSPRIVDRVNGESFTWRGATQGTNLFTEENVYWRRRSEAAPETVLGFSRPAGLSDELWNERLRLITLISQTTGALEEDLTPAPTILAAVRPYLRQRHLDLIEAITSGTYKLPR